jgi:hypothetical protein
MAVGLAHTLYKRFAAMRYHEEPGLLTAFGVLTDTDNTGGSRRPRGNGDIRFRAWNADR